MYICVYIGSRIEDTARTGSIAGEPQCHQLGTRTLAQRLPRLRGIADGGNSAPRPGAASGQRDLVGSQDHDEPLSSSYGITPLRSTES